MEKEDEYEGMSDLELVKELDTLLEVYLAQVEADKIYVKQ